MTRSGAAAASTSPATGAHTIPIGRLIVAETTNGADGRPPLTTNLADARLGAAGVWCTDEFFAPLSRMLEPGEPVFIPDKYDDHGKWMDGWESRRRRGGGHDRSVVRLAAPGEIHAVDIDTPPLHRQLPAGRVPGNLLERGRSGRRRGVGDAGAAGGARPRRPSPVSGRRRAHLEPRAAQPAAGRRRGAPARVRPAASGLDRPWPRSASSTWPPPCTAPWRSPGTTPTTAIPAICSGPTAAATWATAGRPRRPPRARPRLVHHRPGASRRH